MTTNFPSGLDAFTNPSATDAMDSVTVPHATQHADLNDAVEALQAKVGVDGSAVTTSLDYQVANQGLTLVKSQTIGYAVSSVTLTDVFSSDYQNYRIIGEITDSSNNAAIYWNSPQETSTTAFQWAGAYIAVYTAPTSHVFPAGTNVAYAMAGYTTSSGSTTGGCFSMDLYRPYESAWTMCTTAGLSYIGVNAFGRMTTNTSLTDIKFFPSTGNFNGGNIRVYGYNNG